MSDNFGHWVAYSEFEFQLLLHELLGRLVHLGGESARLEIDSEDFLLWACFTALGAGCAGLFLLTN